MRENITIYCLNNKEKRSFPIGTTLYEAYKELGIQMDHQLICARVNYVTEGLNYRLYTSKDVEFISIDNPSGLRTYTRSLCFVLYKAIKNLYPNGKLCIEHSHSNGLFCNISTGEGELTPDSIEKIKQQMQLVVDADIPFHRHECRSDEAIAMFEKLGMEDKTMLLKSNQHLYTHYYTLDDLADYYYGSLVPSTGFITLFDLIPCSQGALLFGANRNKPDEVAKPIAQPKLINAFQELDRFNKIVGLNNVGALNVSINKGLASEIIKVTEALQERKIAAIADEIVKRKEVRVILIAGPSSSGKTTFCKRLQVQLWVNLLKPITLSMDDYFVDRENTPLDENGEHDFESLYSLDLDLFDQQVTALLAGEEVLVPTYNFEKGKTEFLGKKLKLSTNSVLIIEGIHGLNPELLKSVPTESRFQIYASALTTISIDNHNWIPTTDNRLIRRIVRDAKYRNNPAKNTIARWPSVRKGEDKWIFPYQENADAMFNSALLYELAVLKNYAEPILQEVPHNCPEYAEASRLLRFLSYFRPIVDNELPPTSLLREFFGGSSFRY